MKPFEVARSLNIFLPSDEPKECAGRRPILKRWLGKLGPSWRCSPFRRISQILFLLLFLYLFFYVAWPYADIFSGTVLSDKEWIPVEVFLWADPLVGLSTGIATRQWNVAVWGMTCILLLCFVLPRVFCGYICPMGTLIDAFDWSIGRRISRFHTNRRGPWVYARYYVLCGVVIAAACGVLVGEFVSAIPVLTRGMMFTAGQVQFGLLRGWSELAPVNWTFYCSIALFALVFALSMAGSRLWCRYVCPSGALLSLLSPYSPFGRRVRGTCTKCGECARVCSFDAVADDFSTQSTDCTFCQTCGGACPAHAITFERRPRVIRPETRLTEQTNKPPISRRGFAMSIIAGVAVAAMVRLGSAFGRARGADPLRPPGSVSEPQFLDLCIRCGECFQVCPGPVLQPVGFEEGFESLWTPVPDFTHAGCHPDCNFCTQICPTAAIRPLSHSEKKRTHMGLAVIDPALCLAHAGEKACELCYEECVAAGYDAIELRRIELELGDIPPGAVSDMELEEMRYIAAPFVNADACVGCGLCEYRCHTNFVKVENTLPRSAIVVVAENVDRPI